MEVRENPYCPFLVFTGTVNDYVQPGTYMGKYQKERRGVIKMAFADAEQSHWADGRWDKVNARIPKEGSTSRER
jgi:hypothetical protein